MAIRNYKPTTPGRRKMSALVNEEITTSTPEKTLTVTMKKNGGRNNQGKITVRHQGGGVKRRYRIIDFKRNKFNVSGKVVSIEYDPNRTANIALINYADGEKRYIIAPKNLNVGDKIVTSGVSGVFPAGLPVGQVLSVAKNEIKVKPFALLEKLEYIKIVKYGIDGLINIDEEVSDE